MKVPILQWFNLVKASNLINKIYIETKRIAICVISKTNKRIGIQHESYLFDILNTKTDT